MLTTSLLRLGRRKINNKQYCFVELAFGEYQIWRPKTKSSASIRAFNRKFDHMIRIKFNNDENRVSISLRCKLVNNNNNDTNNNNNNESSMTAVGANVAEREFNLNRSQDEEIGTTFQKLYANFQKFTTNKTNKLVKKQKTSK